MCAFQPYHINCDSTYRRGVDRNVVRLLRDRTEGNTMEKVWRQVQENHVEYLQRKDLYTTLLITIDAPGGIFSAMRQTFQTPPAQKLLRCHLQRPVCIGRIRERLFPHLRWSCSVRPLPWPKQRSS